MGYSYYSRKEIEQMFRAADSQIRIALGYIERLSEHLGQINQSAGPVGDLTITRAQLLEARETIDVARDAYRQNADSPPGRHQAS